MKQQISDVHSTGSHSFLLDDDATLPFAASDVLNAMDDKVRVGGHEGRGHRREVRGVEWKGGMGRDSMGSMLGLNVGALKCEVQGRKAE